MNDPNQAWVTDSYRIQRAKRVTRDEGAHFDAKFGDDDANIRVGYAYDDTAREILAFDNSNAAQVAGVAAIPNSAIGQYLMAGPSRPAQPGGTSLRAWPHSSSRTTTS